MVRREAIVVGAGIGGVTAALALERSGWRVTVLERAPALGEVGAGLSVWSPAVRVLADLGVTDLGRSARVSAPMSLRQPGGRRLVRAGSIGMETPVMIHRSQLHDLITARLTGVTVRTGVTVTGLMPDHAGATVTAADGSELRAELVVAADGIRSAIRSRLAPDHRGPRYSGYTAYRGISDAEIDDGGGETWGPGRRFGYAPLVDGRVYWYATANAPAERPAGPQGDHGDVMAAFGEWHDPIPALLAGTPREAVLHNDIYDLTLPLVSFVHGRVVLLGDAAHAMTPNLGMGACAAIEDAGALARQLRAAPDLPTALAGYDADRRPATAGLIRRSRTVGALGQLDNRFARGLRDGALALAGRLLRTGRRPEPGRRSGRPGRPVRRG